MFSLTQNDSRELSSIPASPNIRMIKSRRMRWARHVTSRGERRGSYRVVMGKPEGKSPLGISCCKLDDNIKMDLQEVGRGGGLDWIDQAPDRDKWWALVNAVTNIRIPQNA